MHKKPTAGKRAAPAAAPRRRRRWWLLPVILIPGLLAAAAYVANPRMPPAPELDGVVLELPASPPASAKLEQLMRAKPGTWASVPPPVGADTVRALRAGRWPGDPDQLLEAIDGLKPSLASVEQTVLASPCLPGGSAGPPDDVSFIVLIRAARMAALRAAALAGQGEPARGARAIFPLLDHYLLVEQRCSQNLIVPMVLKAAIELLVDGLAYPLAQPTLDRTTEEEIWRRLLRLETRRSPMPAALRGEATQGRASIAEAREISERSGEGRITTWPYFDREQSLALSDRLSRRRIWIAEQPLDSPALTRPDPEQEFLQRQLQRGAPLTWLRYNHTGQVLLSMRPSLRKYIVGWHQGRCLVAARRARWLVELRQRGRSPAPLASRAAAIDPFRKQPFNGFEDRPLCGAPRSYADLDEKMHMGQECGRLPLATPARPTTRPDAAP